MGNAASLRRTENRAQEPNMEQDFSTPATPTFPSTPRNGYQPYPPVAFKELTADQNPTTSNHLPIRQEGHYQQDLLARPPSPPKIAESAIWNEELPLEFQETRKEKLESLTRRVPIPTLSEINRSYLRAISEKQSVPQPESPGIAGPFASMNQGQLEVFDFLQQEIQRKENFKPTFVEKGFASLNLNSQDEIHKSPDIPSPKQMPNDLLKRQSATVLLDKFCMQFEQRELHQEFKRNFLEQRTDQMAAQLADAKFEVFDPTKQPPIVKPITPSASQSTLLDRLQSQITVSKRTLSPSPSTTWNPQKVSSTADLSKVTNNSSQYNSHKKNPSGVKRNFNIDLDKLTASTVKSFRE